MCAKWETVLAVTGLWLLGCLGGREWRAPLKPIFGEIEPIAIRRNLRPPENVPVANVPAHYQARFFVQNLAPKRYLIESKFVRVVLTAGQRISRRTRVRDWSRDWVWFSVVSLRPAQIRDFSLHTNLGCYGTSGIGDGWIPSYRNSASGLIWSNYWGNIKSQQSGLNGFKFGKLLLHRTPLFFRVNRVASSGCGNYCGQQEGCNFGNGDSSQPHCKSTKSGYVLIGIGFILCLAAFLSWFLLIGFGLSDRDANICIIGFLLGLFLFVAAVFFIHKGIDAVGPDHQSDTSEKGTTFTISPHTFTLTEET